MDRPFWQCHDHMYVSGLIRSKSNGCVYGWGETVFRRLLVMTSSRHVMICKIDSRQRERTNSIWLNCRLVSREEHRAGVCIVRILRGWQTWHNLSYQKKLESILPWTSICLNWHIVANGWIETRLNSDVSLYWQYLDSNIKELNNDFQRGSTAIRR